MANADEQGAGGRRGAAAATDEQGGAQTSGTVAGASVEHAFDPIDAALRQIHERISSEPVPDDFLDLLDQLDRSAGGAKSE